MIPQLIAAGVLWHCFLTLNLPYLSCQNTQPSTSNTMRRATRLTDVLLGDSNVYLLQYESRHRPDCASHIFGIWGYYCRTYDAI